jgi:hypothetical protein
LFAAELTQILCAGTAVLFGLLQVLHDAVALQMRRLPVAATHFRHLAQRCRWILAVAIIDSRTSIFDIHVMTLLHFEQRRCFSAIHSLRRPLEPASTTEQVAILIWNSGSPSSWAIGSSTIRRPTSALSGSYLDGWPLKNNY